MKPLIRFSVLFNRFYLLTRYTTRMSEDKDGTERLYVIASKKTDITDEVLNISSAELREARKAKETKCDK